MATLRCSDASKLVRYPPAQAQMSKPAVGTCPGARSAAGPVQNEIGHSGDTCAQLAAGAPSATDQMI